MSMNSENFMRNTPQDLAKREKRDICDPDDPDYDPSDPLSYFAHDEDACTPDTGEKASKRNVAAKRTKVFFIK
jgi:hypothetical protein